MTASIPRQTLIEEEHANVQEQRILIAQLTGSESGESTTDAD